MPVKFPFKVTVSLLPPDPWRQIAGVVYQTTQFPATATTISKSWGLQPALATMRYAGIDAPATAGHAMRIVAGGHTFWGVCQSDTPEEATSGKTRLLEFIDHRDYLDWDDVFGYFNKINIVTGSGGVRLRRFEHMYPADWAAGVKSYTNNPLTAAAIINYLIAASTVQSPWIIRNCNATTGAYDLGHHASLLAYPAWDIDCASGKTLGQALIDVCEQFGVVFTIGDNPHDLVFARKGEGTLPSFPTLSDEQKNGTILSTNSTRIRVVGGRNLYQCMEIDMIPDWAPGWEEFFDTNKLQDYVFNNMSTQADINGVGIGTPYNAIPGDIEQTVGRQLATARSLEITVGEFAVFRQAASGDGAAFQDWRKADSKRRMDMPAALYIRLILFRAFRFPSDFFIVGDTGVEVPLASLELSSEMIAEVTHDPLTGDMFYDTSMPNDGNGYAIIQGYMVGRDGFATIKPERFNLTDWVDAQEVWQHMTFQIDDSGDVDKFILFDEPVIKSENLFDTAGATATEANGYVGLKSDPTFVTPSVRVSVTFRGEPFEAVFGYGARDRTVNQSQLYEEFLGYGSGWTANDYSDGSTAYEKAQTLAESMLTLQPIYAKGGYKRIITADTEGVIASGTKLTGMIDRVTLSGSADGGMTETVDFTSERRPMSFIADRDFDRQARDRGMFPGQKELMTRANQMRMIAGALRGRPDIVQAMADELWGRTKVVHVDTARVPVAGIKVFTPLRQKPLVVPTGQTKPINTRPGVTGDSSYTVFSGVCLTDKELGGTVRVKEVGEVPCRVRGPVTAGASLGLAEDATSGDYLQAGSDNVCAIALQSVPSGQTLVIKVRLGGGGGDGAAVWL